MLGGIVAVAAEDRVRQRFGQRDRNVEHQLALTVRELDALAAHELHDVLDVSNVVGDVEFDDPRGVVAMVGRAAGRLDGTTVRVCQKLFNARSRVSAIWNNVSSFVSSNSVLRSSLRFARRSSPPCSRIFFDSDTSTPNPELSM